MLGVPVERADALREFDCGVFEGRSDDEAWAAHAAVQREWYELGRPGARIPGGESLTDLRARFVPFVAAVARDVREGDAERPRGAPAGSVLLISHGGLLHSLLPEVLGGLDPATVLANPLGNAAFVVADVDPTAALPAEGGPSRSADRPCDTRRRCPAPPAPDARAPKPRAQSCPSGAWRGSDSDGSAAAG